MADMKQKMDVRTYSRYVEKGALKAADVNTYLKSLPDETENAVWVDLTAEDAELAGDGEGADQEETADYQAEPAQIQSSPEEGT